jgi:hypothetical protein
MFNVQDYPEAKQSQLRGIAEEALGALGVIGVERTAGTPAVEQLGDCRNHADPSVRELAGLATEQMVYCILDAPNSFDDAC